MQAPEKIYVFFGELGDRLDIVEIHSLLSSKPKEFPRHNQSKMVSTSGPGTPTCTTFSMIKISSQNSPRKGGKEGGNSEISVPEDSRLDESFSLCQ